MTKGLVSSRWRQAFHRSPARSQPYQYNPGPTSHLSYLLLNSKDMNTKNRMLIVDPPSTATNLACAVLF